jgi:microcystin-dependent protein
MATTDITINVTVSTDTFAFPFPYLKAEDVRVELREFDTTPGVEEPLISTSASTNFTIPEANPTTIEFTSLGAATIYQNADGTVKVTSDNGYQVQVRIYRNTTADATPATFFAGSAVRAKDLNDNFEKILYIMQERQNFLSNIIAGQFPAGGVNTAALADDSVTALKLRDDPTIDSNRAVTTNHIRDNAVTMAKLAGGVLPTDITVSTDNITGNTIVNADISNSAAIAQSKLDLSITDSEVNASAAIAGTKVSPDFGSQNITTTGSLTANGLSYPTSDGSADEVIKTNGSGTLSFGTIQGVPTGSVFYFAASTAPTGYLKANGDTVPNGSGTIQGVTADFSALYAILGSTYGSAGQLPDLRGEFMRGWDDGKGTDSGRTFGSSQDHQLQLHSHLESYNVGSPGQDQAGSGSGDNDNVGSKQTATSGTTGNFGTETRPRNIALLACIKY